MFSPRIQFIGMLLESVIGVWLLLGVRPRLAAGAGVLLFSTLAVVSFYLGLIGQPSCGCFGRVVVSPWLTLLLDLTCAVALIIATPTPRLRTLTSRHLALVSVAFVAVIALATLLTSATANKAIVNLKGQSLMLPAGDADAGVAPQGETRVVTVTVENVSGTPVRLIGGTASCSCVATADLPLTVPPYGRAEVRVGVKFTGEPGIFLHNYDWYTDCPRQPRVGSRIAGRIGPAVPSAQPAS